MEIPITQSEEWRKLQNDLKETSFFAETTNYQYLAILKSTPAGNYLYLPYGPVANNKQAMKLALQALNTLAKEHHAIFIRLEPQLENPNEYLPENAQKTKDLSPADTWVLDLTPDKPTIIANFSQGTRTRYNTFAKKGLVVTKTKDLSEIKHLVDFQAQLFEKKHLTAYDENYLKAELAQPFTTLYLVKYQPETENDNNDASDLPKKGQILAASLFFDYQETGYYMQSAADYRYKKLPATVALLTTAIFDAKEQGIKYFDFWGIAPDGAPENHPWHGFTEFKKSFGGEARHYAGTYDIVLNPAKYRLYRVLLKVKKMLK